MQIGWTLTHWILLFSELQAKLLCRKISISVRCLTEDTGVKITEPLEELNCWIGEKYTQVSKPLMHRNLSGKLNFMQQTSTSQ